jgi:hypothetical protein
VELIGCEFIDNGDHPIAGGAWPSPDRPALSRRVVIDDTVFSGNRSSLLLIDAQVSIRGSRFEGNGLAPAAARGAWSCCGGAVTLVRSQAEIVASEFRGNGSSGFGGAIHALGARLHISGSTFEGNRAWVGGAIMAWGHPPSRNIWSVDDWIDLPRLELTRTTFRGNAATELGGAVAFAGALSGVGVLFADNEAGPAGGGIASWRSANLPEPYGDVLAALADNTEPVPAHTVSLARPIFVDNRAGTTGAALAIADARAAVGNSIVARNVASGPGGAAVTGNDVRLINAVIADNAAIGIAALPGATVRLGNTVVADNGNENCSLAAQPEIAGPNLQTPGSDCGTAIASRDPGLDDTYAPELFSAARGAGDFGLCVSDPTVLGSTSTETLGFDRIGLAPSARWSRTGRKRWRPR